MVERLKREARASQARRADWVITHTAELAEQHSFQEHKRAAIRSMRHIDRHLPKHQTSASVPLDLRLMSDEQLLAMKEALLRVEKYDWSANARPEQRVPKDYIIWLLLCGRGWGKTRAIIEAVREYCAVPNTRVAIVSKDHRQLRDVLLEGVSGIVACFPPEDVLKIHKGLGDVSVELVNGSTIKFYTAGEPDAVRGQSFDVIVGDEFASWPKNKAQEMLDMLRMCQRESKMGSKVILATTPKRIPHVMDMLKLAEDPIEKVVIARGTSRDNTVLTEEWHRQMERKYGGTRLGRQEIGGELVLDNERALWTGRMIDEARWVDEEDAKGNEIPMPKLVGVMTGVDPSGSKDGDQTGVITVGWDKDKRLYVIENKSTDGDPGVRYRAVCMSAYENNSIEIWYESAYGGDNAAYGIGQAWKDCVREGLIPEGKKCPPIRPSTIKGDKAARAMPVVQLYEQQMNRPDIRRIYHLHPTDLNGLAKLEDEQLIWETDAKKSPNAIDALVHVTHAIMRKLGLMPSSVTSPVSAHSTRRVRGGFNPFAR